MPLADLRGFANRIIGALTISGLLTVGSLLTTGTATVGSVISTGAATSTFAGAVSSTRFMASITDTAGANPPFSFNGDEDTGVTRSAANTLAFSIAGANRMTIAATVLNTGALDIRPSTNGAADIGTNTVAYRSAYFTGGAVSSTLFSAGNGTVGAPSITFGSDLDTGIYRAGSDRLDVVAAGASRLAVLASAVLATVSIAPSNNNSIDLGAYSQAWKNVYASGTVITTNVTTTRLSATGLTAAAAGTTNPICLDSSGNGFIGASQICPLSALSAKEDLKPISYGLKEVLKTDFYDFRTKDPKDKRIRSGPIADYTDAHMPHLTEWRDGQINGFDYLSFIGVLGQAIKDQQKEIDALKSLCGK